MQKQGGVRSAGDPKQVPLEFKRKSSGAWSAIEYLTGARSAELYWSADFCPQMTSYSGDMMVLPVFLQDFEYDFTN